MNSFIISAQADFLCSNTVFLAIEKLASLFLKALIA
jgi:hypothetical protein